MNERDIDVNDVEMMDQLAEEAAGTLMDAVNADNAVDPLSAASAKGHHTFDNITKWTEYWYKRPARVVVQHEGAYTTISVNYSTFGTEFATAPTEEEAKAEVAKKVWAAIDNGDFVGNDDDFAIYKAYSRDDEHPLPGWMQYLQDKANMLDEEE